MIELMKVGGRGMSIVPSGVLENENDSAYIQLRKELVENQKLIGVIDMPSGIFMASSKRFCIKRCWSTHMFLDF